MTERTDWLPVIQWGKMNVNGAAYTGRRTFAELPNTHCWLRICQHAELIDRAEIKELNMDGDDSWICFECDGYLFSIGERGSHVRLSVNDADCPQDVLTEVTEHFAVLLSPHMRDC